MFKNARLNEKPDVHPDPYIRGDGFGNQLDNHLEADSNRVSTGSTFGRVDI